tara:strand:+ start:1155 stop:1397 length:243 start_codon:yes stop_codon:yes gene_type:complete
MEFNNNKYVIIGKDEVDSVDFTKVLETSANTLRYSNDDSKTFVKYEGDQPSFLSGKTEHTHSEILAILNEVDGEWWEDAP